ncbi:MAG: hypothetical protein P9M15_07245 [Candidatus Electryoneaceae bacterium]|nr:hypothetical protein [Candidatus Electryoneaceae bacterium]
MRLLRFARKDNVGRRREPVQLASSASFIARDGGHSVCCPGGRTFLSALRVKKHGQHVAHAAHLTTKYNVWIPARDCPITVSLRGT